MKALKSNDRLKIEPESHFVSYYSRRETNGHLLLHLPVPTLFIAMGNIYIFIAIYIIFIAMGDSGVQRGRKW